MGDRYHSVDSPKLLSDDRYNKLVQETSKGISSFNQLTRSLAQKMSLFGTPQDSRANHQQLKELTDKGNKIVSKINRRLQELNKACTGPHARMRKTQVGKLSNDYKTQVRTFEDTCKKLVASEKQAVERIRRSSVSFRRSDSRGGGGGGGGGAGLDFSNYNEDQLYAQVNVTNYEEEDLARREEDIIHINHQLREVNAAFQEIDELITEQGEAVVEITENTEDAKQNVEGALENLQQADKRSKWCSCSRPKMFCYGVLVLLLIILVISVYSALKK
ncbi:TPA: hypothetical protein N0F65_001984 [Lagenidium giganteum]|uniref:t-SNARE coiled-coil homology domain-containing protein n=1 Tax=Lagenidium giganteum TaxID=4803 RepID=A0AAV2YY92_9STRA|nr:TPA: hypothetical protein N0F65_001984 [Lagenidium giganteum]